MVKGTMQGGVDKKICLGWLQFGQWELEHPEENQSQTETKMPPAEWAMKQVARHVNAMINKEPPPVKRVRATEK